ncbi:MAG: hypothetical protein PHW03_04580 [Eubacteriales bacterium]|nr:hypothetical protein [Eubacteriales bacterium]
MSRRLSNQLTRKQSNWQRNQSKKKLLLMRVAAIMTTFTVATLGPIAQGPVIFADTLVQIEQPGGDIEQSEESGSLFMDIGRVIETDVDADSDSEGDADIDLDSDSNADTDADSDSDANSDSDAYVDGNSDADADADTDTDADSDANSDSDEDADGDSDADINPDAGANAGGDADFDTDIDMNVNADPEANLFMAGMSLFGSSSSEIISTTVLSQS